jgi:predicted Abi (CAAX) family protease
MAMTLKQKPSLSNGSGPSKEGAVKSEQCQDHVDGFFFNHKEVVHHEYAPPGQTINKQYYIKVIWWLRDAVRRKQPQLWASGDWQLHHDNAPPHFSQLV